MQDGNVDLRVVDHNNSHFRFLITTTSHPDGFAQTQVLPLFFHKQKCDILRYGLVVSMTDFHEGCFLYFNFILTFVDWWNRWFAYDHTLYLQIDLGSLLS